MFKDSLKTIALSLIILSLVGVAYAWTEPTVLPPNQDPTISKPLTESGTGQVKKGGLWIGADAASLVGNKGFIVENGNVGIGTTDPKEQLHITASMALGNDVNGQKFIIHPRPNGNGDFLQITNDKLDGTWDWGNGITLRRGGNVGIGTTSPNDKLEIKLNSDTEKVSINLGNMKTSFGVVNYDLGEDIYTGFWTYRYHDPQGCHGECGGFRTDTCNGDQGGQYTCGVSEGRTCIDHHQGRNDPTDWFRIRDVTCIKAGKIELQTTGGTY